MSTTENNKLIVEFIGTDVTVDMYFLETSKRYVEKSDLKFHSDWNWLMEVVEKIETLPDEKFQIEINSVWCNFFDMKNFKSAEFKKSKDESKIENVYNSVVEFIKWHNDKSYIFWEQ